MPIFSSHRDVEFFNRMNKEILENIVGQHVLYYIIDENTETNIYGESTDKMYKDPVLVYALIHYEDQSFDSDKNIPDYARDIVVKLWKNNLIDIGLVPVLGDIIGYNQFYYEVKSVVENKYFGGKEYDLQYTDQIDNIDLASGKSLTIVLNCKYVSPEKIGIVNRHGTN